MDISRNRIVQDKDNVGGLRAIYFHNYDETAVTGGITYTFDTTDTDVIDTLTGASFYKYDLRGTSTLEQSLTASRENGTIFVEQTLTLSQKKLSKEAHEDLYRLASQRPVVLVEDYNGTLQLVGLEYGADFETSTVSTGAAMGDLSGYSWVMKAMEKKPANIVEETAIWTAGNTGSATATDIYTGISINGTAGSATR